jgi:hypothetical protein
MEHTNTVLSAKQFTWLGNRGIAERSELPRIGANVDVRGRAATKRFYAVEEKRSSEGELEATVYRTSDGKLELVVFND